MTLVLALACCATAVLCLYLAADVSRLREEVDDLHALVCEMTDEVETITVEVTTFLTTLSQSSFPSDSWRDN